MKEGEKLISCNIETELKDSYLRYAVSVIASRALPDVRDGLKPSQRRILFAMKNLNLQPNSKHRKCAKIAGDTSGDYHPHGETVIYPTLVRMAQTWVMRYSLINGQGNFGSVDGDPPAAMRYTEARLTSESVALMDDLDKDTVDYVYNYDETRKEPVVFPSKFPNMLTNGCSGIAVGMATNVPPHNLKELSQAVILLLYNKSVSIDEIIKVLPGPDFPTGGIICGASGIREAFSTGKGKILVRGLHEIDQSDSKCKIIVKEIPYNVNKANLITKIADLINDKTIVGVSDIRDESDKQGMRIVIDVKKGELSDVVINQLYKHTDYQLAFNCNMVALNQGLPSTMNIKDLILSWIDHRKEVVIRRTNFLLARVKKHLHILEGYMIALDNLDEVIKIIKGSKSRSVAKDLLIERFMLSSEQADSVLELRLYQITNMEHSKIKKDREASLCKCKEYEDILSSETRLKGVIKKELESLAATSGDRLTRIDLEEGEDLDTEDLIPNTPVILTFSMDDYVKRMPMDTFREQKRGGHGVMVDIKRENEGIKSIYIANTHDYLLVFTNFGRCYWIKVWQLPQGSRKSRGKPLINFLEGISKNERIAAVLKISNFLDGGYILFATKNGIIKKTSVEKYKSMRRKGIYAINVDDGDEMISAKFLKDDEQIMIFSKMGMAVRFDGSTVRPVGRTARGVKGMSLRKGDHVISCNVIKPKNKGILIVSANGYGKRSRVSDFRKTHRGGLGVKSIITNKRNGFVVGAIAINAEDSILMMSSSGQTLRTSVDQIRVMGRATQGVKLVRLSRGDSLVSMYKIDSMVPSEVCE